MKVKKAAVALTTVIIIIGILTLSGTVLVLTSIDASKNSVSTLDYHNTLIYINSCLEEAARKLNFDRNFNGFVTIDTTDLSCEYTVSTIDANLRLIEVRALSGKSELIKSFQADISQNPITVSEN